MTRPNSLFLSAAAQNSHPQLSHVYSWFSRIHPVNISRATPHGLWSRTGLGFSPSYLSQLLSSDEEEQGGGALNESDDSLIRSLRHLMQSADVGIVDIKRVETDIDVGGGRYARRAKFQFQHAANDDESWLDLEDESDGTRTLFRMCPSVFRALDTGGLLVVDELESDLHPLIGAAIVRLFNCPQTNPKNAQILFSTHDTNLLSAITDEPPMRRDQVWLAEKDKEGASQIYPLTDYKPRKAENLERGYLQGRYGAIPFLGSLVSSQ